MGVDRCAAMPYAEAAAASLAADAIDRRRQS